MAEFCASPSSRPLLPKPCKIGKIHEICSISSILRHLYFHNFILSIMGRYGMSNCWSSSQIHWISRYEHVLPHCASPSPSIGQSVRLSADPSVPQSVSVIFLATLAMYTMIVLKCTNLKRYCSACIHPRRLHNVSSGSPWTRPIRPTMRPHDDEMILWWFAYMFYNYLLKIIDFPCFLRKRHQRTDRRTDGRTDGQTRL